VARSAIFPLHQKQKIETASVIDITDTWTA
jgi:hypothetical protein